MSRDDSRGYGRRGAVETGNAQQSTGQGFRKRGAIDLAGDPVASILMGLPGKEAAPLCEVTDGRAAKQWVFRFGFAP